MRCAMRGVERGNLVWVREFRFGGEGDGKEGEGRGGIVRDREVGWRCAGVVGCRIKEGCVCITLLIALRWFEVCGYREPLMSLRILSA